MKKVLILMMLGVCFLTSYAKKEKVKLDFLKGEKELEIVFDYSETKINRMPETEFVEMKKLEYTEVEGMPWDEYWHKKVKNMIRAKFIKAFNEGGNIHASYTEQNSKANYIATLYVRTVDLDGETGMRVVFTKRGSDTILAEMKVNGDGGSMAKFEKLWGNAYQKAGKNFATLISKSLK